MPTESLKSKLEGNQLDLSLSSLTSVPPVKELAALPKATSLDLSCNLLTFLPPDFCSLAHIVKLDLSKNQLAELPENFGELQKLQHLDLYQNKLTALPVSFCRLNALKWLDLRDNALEDDALVAAAGDCLSEAQCRTCAKQVVAYMKKVQSDQERERQKRLKEEREQEAARKAEEEQEQQRRRAEKKAEKELQRQLRLAKRLQEQKDGEAVAAKMETTNHSLPDRRSTVKPKLPNRNGLSRAQIILTVLLLTIAVVCGLYIYCTGQSYNHFCVSAARWTQKIANATVSFVNDSYTSVKSMMAQK